jgi:hypothetical protein
MREDWFDDWPCDWRALTPARRHALAARLMDQARMARARAVGDALLRPAIGLRHLLRPAGKSATPRPIAQR